MGTELVERRRGEMDLRTPPWQQWSADMVKLARKTVLPSAASDAEVYFCLALAESIGLNPFANEIFFIPGKSKDGGGKKISAYVGREGLVKKAAERGAYFDADTVHANDTFVVKRHMNGTRSVKHEYGHSAERGEIVGAYAFLYGPEWKFPSFFYAELDQYKPTFDQDWKLASSPWGNQLSAMIEKCACIGAGRKRLNLAGVLSDGEIERVQQQQAGQGPGAITTGSSEFDWGSLQVSEETVSRLRAAVDAMNEFVPLSWPPARLEMVLSGMSEAEAIDQAQGLEANAERIREQRRMQPSEATVAADVESPAPGPDMTAAAGSGGEEPVDAVVVVVDADHVAALRARLRDLTDRMNEPGIGEHEASELAAEFDHVEIELAAAEDPGQTSLGV